jgi:hypothetical protein
MNYYDWKESAVTCRECGWSGRGRDTELGEMFGEGAEYHCPKCSDQMVFVPFLTATETLTDPRSDPADRQIASLRLNRQEKFERSKLKTVRQLPDLDPSPKVLAWHVVTDSANQNFFVILNGDQEIWREVSWYENFHRFLV